jgi:hypothetical protein
MSSRSYGIYQQGAIFYRDDFDPAKVIIAVIEKCHEDTVPDHIRTALAENRFVPNIASELDEIFDMRMDDHEEKTDYSYISNSLVDDSEQNEWFIGNEPLMGTDSAEVLVYSDIEGDFVYANNETGDDIIEGCFMFALSFPKAWDIEEHKGIRTKEEAVQAIREAAKPLLKDNIDWSKRLGFLIGSTYG